MTLVVVCVAFFVLTPRELVKMNEIAVAHAVCLTNVCIVLKNSGSYFAEPLHLQPLTHTWSLSVEEQFYLFLPPLLVFCHRFGRKRLFQIVASLSLLSLVASAYLVFSWQKFAFFMLPTRAWELLLGSLVAIRPVNATSWRTTSNEVLAVVGLAGILCPILFYTEHVPFPGLAALPPCLGCCAVIIANTNVQTRVGALLSSNWMTALGAISYSVYLWHWPLFTFRRILFGRETSVSVTLLLIVASLVLAVLSWRFIEVPFRRRHIALRTKSLFTFVASVSAAIVLTGLVIRHFDGFPQRFDPLLVRDIDDRGDIYAPATPEFLGDRMQRLGSKEPHCDVILWGDSHGMVLAEAIDEVAAKLGISVGLALQYQTPPIPGVWTISKMASLRRTAAVLEYIKSQQIKNVMIVARWSAYTDGFTQADADDMGDLYLASGLAKVSDDVEHAAPPSIEEAADHFEVGIRNLAEELNQVGSTLFILEQPPEQVVSNVATHWLRSTALGSPAMFRGAVPPVSYADFVRRQGNVNKILDRIAAEHANVRIIKTSHLFFKQDQLEDAMTSFGGHSLYNDNDHLSIFGGKYVVDAAIKPFLERLKSD